MYEIETRTLQAQPTLTMHGIVAVEDIKAWLGKAYEAVERHASRIHASFAGPPFARYRSLDDTFEKFEIEAGLPVLLAVEGDNGVAASELPGGPAAVTVHVGAYDEMTPAYAAINEWLAVRGAAADGAPWEVYFTDPNEQPDPTAWRTEIVQPYRTD